MNLYRSMERILYHLVLVVGGWLVKMLKIVEKLGGLYGSAAITICNSCAESLPRLDLVAKLPYISRSRAWIMQRGSHA